MNGPSRLRCVLLASLLVAACEPGSSDTAEAEPVGSVRLASSDCTIDGELRCSSTRTSFVDIDTGTSELDGYTCGTPFSSTQAAPEDVYTFECQADAKSRSSCPA